MCNQLYINFGIPHNAGIEYYFRKQNFDFIKQKQKKQHAFLFQIIILDCDFSLPDHRFKTSNENLNVDLLVSRVLDSVVLVKMCV